MKISTICQAILFSFVIVSCNSTPSPTPIVILTSTLVQPSPIVIPTSTPEATPIPAVTAIHINDSVSQDELAQLVLKAFDLNPSCSRSILKFENERKEAGKPIFTEKESEFSSVNMRTSGIAENENQTMQAFIACIPMKEYPDRCQDRVIVRDRTLNKLYDVGFYGQVGNRPTYDATWFGDDIFAFWQDNGATAFVIAISAKTREYAFIGLFFYDAPGC